MAKNKSTVEVIPSARRLIHSLRDVGYDFRHAVADLVDNCIAANASAIAIEMRFDGKDSWFRIADNGAGMSGKNITEAMRFGTERDYEADELGKFGLGLKTASLSQCARVTVASRDDIKNRRIEARKWDLAHVEKTNRWEIIDISPKDRPRALIEPLQATRGTVVLWELMDRVLGYRIPWGDRAKAGFFRLAEELDLHLGMVFHRFLSGEAKRKKKLNITINDSIVEPWDPFARDEKATIQLQSRQFEVHGDNGPGLVAFSPYILPPQEKFSSPKAFAHSAGPGKWNYQQGFYIYRADRVIQSGGWSYMRTSDEHTKLARVALDFWPDLDSAFELNVAKARVNLPADLRGKLQPHVEHVAKHARKVYSPTKEQDGAGIPTRDANIAQENSRSSGSGVNNSPERGHGQMTEAISDGSGLSGGSAGDDPNRGDIGVALERAATEADENQALKKIQTVLRQQSPRIATEIGW